MMVLLVLLLLWRWWFAFKLVPFRTNLRDAIVVSHQSQHPSALP
jgi:hypothetical protein